MPKCADVFKIFSLEMLFTVTLLFMFFLQFYCGDREYNDLATIFFNTQVNRYSILVLIFQFGLANVFYICLQDDAIRNLFSAKTIHEFSSQSLLTFLVLHYCSDHHFTMSAFSFHMIHFPNMNRARYLLNIFAYFGKSEGCKLFLFSCLKRIQCML